MSAPPRQDQPNLPISDPNVFASTLEVFIARMEEMEEKIAVEIKIPLRRDSQPQGQHT
jgi:hypothetical protein